MNIDHVATIRNAREDVFRIRQAAKLAVKAGADGITAHREDRRHIADKDIARLSSGLSVPLNLEMAATEEMLISRFAIGLAPLASSRKNARNEPPKGG